ncbi:MAG: hypothetical protein ABSE86_24900 [Bryobacteraceae bacterium]|jgi:hypothetical protein
MEPFEKDELTEGELDRLLREWNAPAAPARLRAALFLKPRAPWWRRLWTLSIPVPLPIACVLTLLIVVSVWRGAMPRVPQVVVKTERVEVPIVQERVITKYVYKEQKAASGFDIHGLKPVAELRPRIIRSGDAKN